jgi:raffinose/stachyose/melibiose transport system substrate-binding protein
VAYMTGRLTVHRTLASLGLAAIFVAGCATPGAISTPAPTASPASAAPAESGSAAASESAAATVPDCGTEPVKLSIYHETISELMPQLSAEFTKQYPNVTFDLKSDSFANATANLPRLLAGDNPPDISRAAQLIDLQKDGLLLNLDPYATAYGWDDWPRHSSKLCASTMSSSAAAAPSWRGR